ncbi:hypothetical protein TI04_10505 [Achromatium sp. WMS2]|nr:hypothetical protein TI04_10505 [Achromatium sp. WMS2]
MKPQITDFDLDSLELDTTAFEISEDIADDSLLCADTAGLGSTLDDNTKDIAQKIDDVSSCVSDQDVAEPPTSLSAPDPTSLDIVGEFHFSLDFLDEIFPSSTQQSDRVSALLATQQSDGNFLLSVELRNWLGDRVLKIEAAAILEGEALVATFVAIMLLQNEASNQASMWKEAVTKAQNWLNSRGKTLKTGDLLKGLICLQ